MSHAERFGGIPISVAPARPSRHRSARPHRAGDAAPVSAIEEPIDCASGLMRPERRSGRAVRRRHMSDLCSGSKSRHRPVRIGGGLHHGHRIRGNIAVPDRGATPSEPRSQSPAPLSHGPMPSDGRTQSVDNVEPRRRESGRGSTLVTAARHSAARGKRGPRFRDPGLPGADVDATPELSVYGHRRPARAAHVGGA